MAEESSHAHLTSYFDKSTAAVRDYSVKFERSYGRPAVDYCVSSFETYPTTSTFFAIFSLLSFFPVLFFIAISLCMIISVIFIALAGAIFTILVTGFFFITILASILTSLLILTIPLTACTIFTYIFARFIVLARSDGRAGITEWATETRGHFTYPGATMRRSVHSKTGQSLNDNDDSENSVVVVGKREQQRDEAPQHGEDGINRR